MRTKAARSVFVGLILLSVFWTHQPIAQEPPSKPTAPVPPVNPPEEKSQTPKLLVPPLLGRGELGMLERELYLNVLPKPNAMPGTQKDRFMETQGLLLRLVNEVIILQDRVAKLEQQAKK